MEMYEKKSLTGKKEDVEEAAENLTDEDNKDVLMKQVAGIAPATISSPPPPSVRGSAASGFSGSGAGMFKSAALSKANYTKTGKPSDVPLLQRFVAAKQGYNRNTPSGGEYTGRSGTPEYRSMAEKPKPKKKYTSLTVEPTTKEYIQPQKKKRPASFVARDKERAKLLGEPEPEVEVDTGKGGGRAARLTQLTSRDSGTDPSGQGPKTTNLGQNRALAQVSKRGNLPPGVTIKKVNKSMFKSASNAKGGSPCAPEAAKADSGPVWEGGKTYKETPIEEDGQYNPPGWSAKGEEDDDKKKKKDVKKSLFASAELSKAVASISPGELKMSPELSKPIKEPSKSIFDPNRGKLLGGKKLKASSVTGKTKKFAESQQKPASQATGEKLRVKDEFELKNPGTVKTGEGQWSSKPTHWSDKWKPEGMEYNQTTPKPPLFKKSITELRYGSQLARNHDVGKSCGMCGRISKSCGDHKGGGCCDDCKKSMSSTQWHKSHLS